MYRMFVDEVGRYLSLTGIVFDLEYYDRVAVRWVNRLKEKHFPPLPSGKPLILHRKELVNRKWPFTCLQDPARQEAFNHDLLLLLEKLEYMVLTASIDKLEHVKRYQDPGGG